jgi:multidrug efflux pump
MLTVPLAVAGALFALWASGGTLNIYSQIGIVILIGLAAKNGILIVEFTNQLRDRSLPFEDALREAARTRFRPILMTGLSTAIGALPLVLAGGAGSASRATIGIVIFAGVLFATLLTLFVVPVFYSLLARRTGSPDAAGRSPARLVIAPKAPGAWRSPLSATVLPCSSRASISKIRSSQRSGCSCRSRW